MITMEQVKEAFRLREKACVYYDTHPESYESMCEVEMRDELFWDLIKKLIANQEKENVRS